MNYRKASPLFFLLLILMILSHSVYAPASIQFSTFCDNSINTGTTISCTVNGIGQGTTIIVNIYGVGAFAGFTVTDNLANSYSVKVSSITGSGGGASTLIFTTLSTAPGASATVTVATGGNQRNYGFTASAYIGVTGFGKTGTDQQDSAGVTGSTTISLSGTLGSSLMIDDIFTTSSNTFTLSGSGQTIRDSFTSYCGTPSACRTSDTTSPVLTWSWSGGSNCTPCTMSHSSLELQGGTPSSQTNVTQCYGNCGTPAITIVNTNSTHAINFNQSITLFYEFQSNLNGFIQNYSINYAQICGSGSKCIANSLFTALYTIANCPLGNTPFSAQCPGSRVSAASTTPPTKQRFTAIASNIQVIAGQWIAVAMSASFIGSDINDTNTNVPLFQTNGITPTTISASTSASNLCGGCKMGLWAFISGNVVINGPPTSSSPANCGNGIGDFLQCLTLSFCTGTPNIGCQLAGGFFWAVTYSGIGIVLVMWADRKLAGQGEEGERIIPGDVYFFIPIGVFFMFVALGALPPWVAFLIFAIVAYLFADLLSRRGRGGSG